jgi:hypothetical protein
MMQQPILEISFEHWLYVAVSLMSVKIYMYTEKGNDEYYIWHEAAGQADFDSF